MRLEFVTDQRGYCVEMERDLFGDVVLRRRWYSPSHYTQVCRAFLQCGKRRQSA